VFALLADGSIMVNTAPRSGKRPCVDTIRSGIARSRNPGGERLPAVCCQLLDRLSKVLPDGE